MDVYSHICRHFVIPLWAKWERTPYLQHLTFLQKSQFFSEERIKKIQWKKITPRITDLPDGKQHVELPPGGCEMVVDADLAPGERATGYVYYEWEGGFSFPCRLYLKGWNCRTLPRRNEQ